MGKTYRGWKIIHSYRVGWLEGSHDSHESLIHEKTMEEMIETIDVEYPDINTIFADSKK